MTKQDLLKEGEILADSIQQKYERFLGDSVPNGYRINNEQRYRNWLENVQGYVYQNKIYPEQYEEFKRAKDDISPESHQIILSIINSIK